MGTFKLAPNARLGGTYFRDRIMVSPKRLVEVFGPPLGGDGYKVSGTYAFTDEAGHVFTVYDWKETSLFDDGLREGEESSAPTPEEFWGNWNPEVLHIGGRDAGDVEAFKQWLTEQLAGTETKPDVRDW